MNIKHIVLVLYLSLLHFYTNANNISKKEKREITTAWESARKSRDIMGLLTAAYGNKQSLEKYISVYSCQKSAGQFLKSLNVKFGGNAWKEYQSIISNSMSASHDFVDSIDSYKRLKDNSIHILTKKGNELVFNLYKGKYTLDTTKTFTFYNPYFLAHIKNSFNLGNSIVLDQDFKGSLKSLKDVMAQPLNFPPRKSIELKYTLPPEGLTYLSTFNMKQKIINGSNIYKEYIFLFKIKPSPKKDYLNINAIVLVSPALKKTVINYSFKLSIDSYGNILEVEELPKNASSNLRLIRLIYLNLCIIPSPRRKLYLGDLWKAKRQVYLSIKKENRSILKLNYWYKNKDITYAKISKSYSSYVPPISTCNIKYEYNVTKGFVVKASDHTSFMTMRDNKIYSIMEIKLKCELVSADFHEIIKRYKLE